MAAEKTAEEKQTKGRRRRDSEIESDASGKGRATPGRRKRTDKQEGNALTRPLFAVRDYFEGVQSELEKVSWPTREEALRLARIVLLVTVASSLILGTLSVLAGQYLDLGLQNEIIFVISFALIIAGAFWMMRRGWL